MANILLAEDDSAMRQFLTTALEKAGHTITPCEDGMTALDALEKDAASFDLLLSDIVMPGIDGIELSNHAGRLNPSLKILFITGFAAVAAENLSGTVDNPGIVSKPFHLGQLVKQIDEILGAA